MSDGEEEKSQVAGDKGGDATQVYALCGKTIQRHHRTKPHWPRPVYWMDQSWRLLSLEGSPTGPGPSHPSPRWGTSA